jgi:hypothetical protein
MYFIYSMYTFLYSLHTFLYGIYSIKMYDKPIVFGTVIFRQDSSILVT